VPYYSMINVLVNQKLNEIKTLNVSVDDEMSAKKYLIDNNHFLVVKCGKIKFLDTSDKRCLSYNASNFKEWIEYFDKDKRLSQHLLNNVIEFERKLNARVAYYVTTMIEFDERIDPFIKNEFIYMVNTLQLRKMPIYTGSETIKFIDSMDFGQLVHLLEFFSKKSHEYLIKSYIADIVMSMKLSTNNFMNQLNDLRNLRNNLAHFTPLNIYLVGELARVNRKKSISIQWRKKTVNFVYKLNVDEKLFNVKTELFNCCDRYIHFVNT